MIGRIIEDAGQGVVFAVGQGVFAIVGVSLAWMLTLAGLVGLVVGVGMWIAG